LARLTEVSIELGLLDEAEHHVEEAVALCRPFAHRRLLTLLSGLRGAIEHERDNPTEARKRFDEALDHARELGAELLEPFYRALRGAVLADSDQIEAASEDLDYAESQIPRFGDVLRTTVSLMRGHLDLAHSRALAARGDVAGSLAHRTRAEG